VEAVEGKISALWGVKSNYHFFNVSGFCQVTGALMDYEMHYADGRDANKAFAAPKIEWLEWRRSF
jgi:hypothetical protein